MYWCAHDQKLNHRCEHTLMVCSHFPTWIPIQIPINYGQHRILWRRHGAQRQRPSQIPTGLCSNVIGICVSLGLGVGQCERTIGPPHILHVSVMYIFVITTSELRHIYIGGEGLRYGLECGFQTRWLHCTMQKC